MSHSSQQTGTIITFYSYKGGTGRTMALANVAWILATNGHRVLAVDWDLESPGLHRYFHPFLVDKKLRTSRGVIDMVRDFASAAMEDHDEGDPDWYTQLANVEREAVSLTWRFPGKGVIDLLPAGKQDASYFNTVSTFEWPAFYDRLNGGVFLRSLRDNMREHYDYVLIDSRTGLSDTASICTVLLPDLVVDCLTLNEQSIDGAAAVAGAIARQRDEVPVRIMPVPMRVEDAEQIKLEAGRDYARQRFAQFLDLAPEAVDRYWGDIEIPYKPFYAYEEILAGFGDRSMQENSLLASFERLTRTITGGAVSEMSPMPERDRRRWLAEFERPKTTATSDVLISYAAVDRMWAEWVGTELNDVGLRVNLQEIDFAAGSPDNAEVEHLVASVSRVLILLSQDYVGSAQAAEFWRLVSPRDPQATTRLLVPVRIDGVRVGPPFGERLPAVDFTNLDEDSARAALLHVLDQPTRTHRDTTDGARRGPRFPAVLPPVWNVPQRNVSFTGRGAVLEGLRNRLSSSPTVVVPQALYGLGGVGKTQVAIEYAHRFAANYDIVWWVSAEQPDQVRASLAQLAERLGLPRADTVTENVRAALDALRAGDRSRRWLVVFDNAGDPEELREYLPQGSGHTLLTSRNLSWSRQARTVEVDVFTREESISFLRKRVPALPIPDADAVAEKLGDLPLAIEQAGAWLAATAMPVATYMQLLDTQMPQVLSTNPPPAYDSTAAATWLLSLQRLRETMPAAAKVLELCAFFAPEPIPMTLLYSERFVEVLLPYDPTLSEPLLQGRLVQEIGRYSLASIDTAASTIQLHRLVQAVIRDRLTAEERQDCQQHVHEILAAANPRDGDVTANWPMYSQLRLHLRAAGVLGSRNGGVRQLVIDTVRYLWKASDYQSSEELATDAIDVWRRLSNGVDDLTTLWMRVQLGNALRSGAKYAEALANDEQVYAALMEEQGPDHPFTITSISSLAASYRALNRYDEARALDEEAYERSKRVLGEDQFRTLNALNNLAVSLRMVGDFTGATQLDEETLRRRRRVYGERGLPTLISAHNYGRDLRDIGRYQDARKQLEYAVNLHRDELGDDHPETLRTSKTLAVTLRKVGELNAAHALSLDILPRFNQVLGRKHPDTISAANNLACDQSALGDDRTARQTAEDAYERYQSTLGNDHAFTLACANNLAIFMRRLGDHESARPIAERVVRRFEAVLGAEHPYTLACMINLANEYYDAGEYTAALRVDDELYPRMVAALGADHPDTLAAGNNLSVSQNINGDRAAAAALTQHILAVSVRILGENHPNAVAIRNGARLNCDIDPPQS